ncbi:hypothetical protein DL98DRAFT_586553 [Cadophora sp. DSE1049]|nr:hypothetical protein DL98DRAFT_586553 [Cadophora sp. DSE1049]
MHFTSIAVLGIASLAFGLPIIQFRQDAAVAPAGPTPASSLTPSQIQTLICQAFERIGEAGNPVTGVPAFCIALVVDPISNSNNPSTSSPSVNLPLDGAGGLASIPAGILGGLVVRDDVTRRQVGGSTTGGGVLDLGAGGVPGFVAGLGRVPEATSVISGVAGSLPGLLGTVQGLGGILAREAEGMAEGINVLQNHPLEAFRDLVRQKSRRALDALSGVVGGLPIVGGLLTGVLPAPNTSMPSTGSLTGGLPVVGNGGLSGYVPFFA